MSEILPTGSAKAASSNSLTICPCPKKSRSPPLEPDGQSDFSFAISANFAAFSSSGRASSAALISLIFFSASAAEVSALAFCSLISSSFFCASAL